jgi:hypothetical protein
MLLAYPLLFLLSASTGDATSRNPRIFLHPGGADVPVPSPAIHDHRRIIAKVQTHARRAEFYFSTLLARALSNLVAVFPRVNGGHALHACRICSSTTTLMMIPTR